MFWGHIFRGSDSGILCLAQRDLSPEESTAPGIEKGVSLDPYPSSLLFPPRAEDEAIAAPGQLIPGTHSVPSKPATGVTALSKGAIAPGSFTHELRACPPQQAGPYCPQGEWLLFSSEDYVHWTYICNCTLLSVP